VGKKADEAFTARASIDARMKPTMASKADSFERKRLLPTRSMTRVTKKTMIARRASRINEKMEARSLRH
jgi:hypothetical protein